jgi:hypothetical protein
MLIKCVCCGSTAHEHAGCIVAERDALKSALGKLREAMERIICANGDYYTEAPECEHAVAELQDAIRAAANIMHPAILDFGVIETGDPHPSLTHFPNKDLREIITAASLKDLELPKDEAFISIIEKPAGDSAIAKPEPTG